MSKTKESKSQIREEIMKDVLEMHDKYESLVKYARVTPQQISEHKLVKELVVKVESSYPTEVEGISGRDGDWHHGFNSGMLAALRYIITSDSIDKETATDWFPELDT